MIENCIMDNSSDLSATKHFVLSWLPESLTNRLLEQYAIPNDGKCYEMNIYPNEAHLLPTNVATWLLELRQLDESELSSENTCLGDLRDRPIGCRTRTTRIASTCYNGDSDGVLRTVQFNTTRRNSSSNCYSGVTNIPEITTHLEGEAYMKGHNCTSLNTLLQTDNKMINRESGQKELSEYRGAEKTVNCVLPVINPLTWEINPIYEGGEKGGEDCSSCGDPFRKTNLIAETCSTDDVMGQRFNNEHSYKCKSCQSLKPVALNCSHSFCNVEKHCDAVTGECSIGYNLEVEGRLFPQNVKCKLTNDIHIDNPYSMNNVDCILLYFEGFVFNVLYDIINFINCNANCNDDITMNLNKITASDETKDFHVGALEYLDEVIESFKDLCESEENISDTDIQEVVDRNKDLFELFENVDEIVEETLKEYIVSKSHEGKKFSRQNSLAETILSDDVFLGGPIEDLSPESPKEKHFTMKRCDFPVNKIFDNGKLPPIPPERKKKMKKPPIDSVPSKLSSENNTKTDVIAQTSLEELNTNVFRDKLCFSFSSYEKECSLDMNAHKQITKRRAKSLSLYDFADACCQGHNGCQLQEDFTVVKHEQVPCQRENLPYHQHLNSSQLTPVKFISSIEYHPIVSHNDSKEVLVPADSPQMYVNDSNFLPERCRKGSGSSDIAAWKQDLQRSCLFCQDDDFDNENMYSEEWFSSNDGEGRVYFFEENSNESSWTLPSISIAEDKSTSNDKGTQKHEALPNQPSADFQLRNIGTTEKSVNRAGKSHSMVLPQQKWKEDNASVTYSSRKWPELRNGDMEILKEGDLNYTKITEHGKKVRKNWTLSHIVLTEPVLLISKEPKSFQQKNALLSSSLPCPELCIDLNGAQLENPSKLSRRKHVFGVISMLGLHILIQCPNSSSMDSWLSALQKAIKNLPSEFSNRLAVQHVENLETRESDDHKRSSRVTRAKSMKIKNKEGMEDVTSSLRKFFIRRPTKEALMKKGIYKDEPVFGRNLQDVCGNERPYVPMFVKRCIEVIEKEENMKTDGLYRVSGNLSQVQKIRFQVDQNQLQVLDKEEDVHVLTGALKLFFRELKKPLIPFELYSKALEARALTDKKRLEKIKEILKPLPSCHRDTLKYLLEHLLRVTKFKDDNRMHIPNLAIVFGPTLIWSEEDKSQDMYFDMMQQNLVIECLLQNFSEIF